MEAKRNFQATKNSQPITKEQQREAKALKLEARKQAKIQAKQERQEAKAWDKMMAKWRAKGALIEDLETGLTNQ